jgi:hypothetical protein
MIRLLVLEGEKNDIEMPHRGFCVGHPGGVVGPFQLVSPSRLRTQSCTDKSIQQKDVYIFKLQDTHHAKTLLQKGTWQRSPSFEPLPYCRA